MSCELCAAIQNEPERIVHQDALVVVMLNKEPIKEGHLMILPARHAENLSHLEPAEAKAFLDAIDACMSTVTAFSPETPMCLVNGWKHRTQPHLHAHVLPSQHAVRGLFTAAEGTPDRRVASQEELTEITNKLKPLFKKS